LDDLVFCGAGVVRGYDPNIVSLILNGFCRVKDEGDAEVPFPARKICGDNGNFHNR
jgi:hypothetical protein